MKGFTDQDWFSDIGYPPRDFNLILPMIDGEEAWKKVAEELRMAKKNIHIATWDFEFESELIRNPELTFKEPEERVDEIILRILTLKAKEGLKVRLLLWNIPVLSQNKVLRAIGASAKDNFEILEERHPNLIGSYHQKTITIDGAIAFVGGMNLTEQDWDTISHSIYDYRRTPHSYSAGRRKWMQERKKIPDFPPRHDLFTYIKGPLVADVEANFVQRWNSTKESGVDWSNNASTLTKIPPPSRNGTQKGQIVRTMPCSRETPAGERGILDTYKKAIRNARSYIYIEDQFFRSQEVAKELALVYKKNPNLTLIVVTIPDYLSKMEVGESWKFATPSSYWTAKAFNTIKAVHKDFCLFYLQMFGYDVNSKPIFVPVYIHAKIMIVDDLWCTIGSCNVNDRGFLYEGEINVAALDQPSAKELRIKLWTEHMEAPCPEDLTKAVNLWRQHAGENHKAWEKKNKPKSRIFPFDQTGPLLPLVKHTWF
ncbi:MAG: phospholipase D-like domain-containing protein [Bacillota bacterium]